MALVSEPMSGDRMQRWRKRLAAYAPAAGWTTARRLPAGASFVAGIVALLSALGLGSLVVEPSGAVLPIDPSSVNAVDAVASAVALLALSVGLARGKKLAWYLAIATFGSAMVLQLVVEGHVIAGSLAGICLAVLIGDRLRYRARTDGRLIWPVAIALGLGAALVVAEAVVVGLVTGQAQAALDALTGWLSFDDPTGLAGTGGALVIGLLDLATRVLLAVAVLAILRAVAQRRSDPVERALALDVGRRHATGALVPFQFGEGTEPFLGPDGNGLVVYGRAGRVTVMLGDPIGPAASAQAAFEGFVERCVRNDEVPTVYQASAANRPQLIAAGLRPFKVGQEATLDLATFSLDGSRRANLRHTVSRARRGGVDVRWFPYGLPADEIERCGQALVEVDSAWQAGAGPQLGFTIGRFSLDDLATVALAVAMGPAGEPLAFATFRPTDASGGWVLDLVRRLPGSVPGALEACIVAAALGLKAADQTSLSLGLAPLAGLDTRSPDRTERLLAHTVRLVRRWYDVDGLAFFKQKFDPTWEPRYGAVQRPWNLPGFASALLRLHLAGPGGSLLVAGRAAVDAAFSAVRR